jgi:hypothetical protein
MRLVLSPRACWARWVDGLMGEKNYRDPIGQVDHFLALVMAFRLLSFVSVQRLPCHRTLVQA